MSNVLMTAGPSEIEKEILLIGAHNPVYTRTADFTTRLGKIFDNLQYLFRTSKPVLILTASGTGAMEAGVVNFFQKEDRVLVINGGTFGSRWKQIALKNSLEVVEFSVTFGESPSIDEVLKIVEKDSSIKAVFATHNETSSGALTDIEALGKGLQALEIQRKIPAKPLLIVDAVSSLLVENLSFDEWHIDVAISSSQKALALPAGLSFIALSDVAINKLNSQNPSYYFDLKDYLSNWERKQTPFTPANGLLLQLERRLEKIQEQGLEAVYTYYLENTLYLRNKLKEIDLQVFAKNPANAVTGIMFDTVDADLIIKKVSEIYKIELAGSGGDLKHRFLRIGNYGAISQKEIDMLIQALTKILKD